jgi:hypothetical protein
MDISAKLVAGSIGKENGVKLATMEIEYPRVLLAEFNTHRVFSRNGKSSRAVPFKRMVDDLRKNFFSPLQWLQNQPGMVATEVMSPEDSADCDVIWEEAMADMIYHATRLNEKNASKQYVNRLLEPFGMTKTLVSSTRWGNFFKLRDHKDAVPEFQLLAALMKEQFDHGEFVERSAHNPIGGWHLPYISNEERITVPMEVELGLFSDPREIPTSVFGNMKSLIAPPDIGLTSPGMRTLLMMCVARCCRLSYGNFDGEPTTVEQDRATFLKLANDPLHASPMEHAAFPTIHRLHNPSVTGNFHGFRQFRKIMPNEAVEEAII